MPLLKLTFTYLTTDSATSTTKENDQSQNQLEEAVNEACQENSPTLASTDLNQSTTTASNSNFNV